jgi:hypothetical protein
VHEEGGDSRVERFPSNELPSYEDVAPSTEEAPPTYDELELPTYDMCQQEQVSTPVEQKKEHEQDHGERTQLLPLPVSHNCVSLSVGGSFEIPGVSDEALDNWSKNKSKGPSPGGDVKVAVPEKEHEKELSSDSPPPPPSYDELLTPPPPVATSCRQEEEVLREGGDTCQKDGVLQSEQTDVLQQQEEQQQQQEEQQGGGTSPKMSEKQVRQTWAVHSEMHTRHYRAPAWLMFVRPDVLCCVCYV